ncbi:polysaccharide deacetylase family protein [Microaerobacter geothermalis]|uniref:polysaccharide deacetylase family protein n=1 Tax=Microaerobacter geothermalis TaxID=674972 RepID=UPI001F3B3984|nr:polysaccharide deacetylase family protein [Microaerobacter geothermalis]MCF6093508.1 polysaccharide deacetylase family protein [Microaerobacter geothermalis]
MTKKFLMILTSILIIVLMISGCGDQTRETAAPESSKVNNTKENDGVSKPIAEPDPVTEKQTPDSEKSEESSEDNPPEDELSADERYYVNPNNFRIYPVDKNNNKKIVLLTFDDAPYGDATLDILNILDKYDAKAIWFINGIYAVRNKPLLEEIANRGHVLGNHTWEHDFLRKMTPEQVRKEIVSVSDLIEEVTGERPKYFRPPFGQNSDISLQVIKEEGMQTMNWSVGSLDWNTPAPAPDEITKQVLSTMHNGGNILFHDKTITAQALDDILKSLSEQGYRFVVPTEVRPE